MDRRLHFLLPDTDHALAVVNELVQAGADPEQIHALVDSGTSLGELPGAPDRQIHDTSRHIETVVWNGNLAVFGVALGVPVTLLVVGRPDAWLLLHWARCRPAFWTACTPAHGAGVQVSGD